MLHAIDEAVKNYALAREIYKNPVRISGRQLRLAEIPDRFSTISHVKKHFAPKLLAVLRLVTIYISASDGK